MPRREDPHDGAQPDEQPDDATANSEAQPNTEAPADSEADSGRTGGAPRAKGRVTDAERARMRTLAEAGHSVREIATEVGRSPDAVSRAVRDVANHRREQTRAATTARTVDFAEQRTRLMDQTLRVARMALAQVVSRADDDSRGRVDEARTYGALVSAYSRLDERHVRAQTGDGSDIDAYLDLMAPDGDPA